MSCGTTVPWGLPPPGDYRLLGTNKLGFPFFFRGFGGGRLLGGGLLFPVSFGWLDIDPLDVFIGFIGPVGIGGGRSGGTIPSTDMADGSVGSLAGRFGLWPNLPISPPRPLSLAFLFGTGWLESDPSKALFLASDPGGLLVDVWMTGGPPDLGTTSLLPSPPRPGI